jgi:hypothetical protein
VWFLSLLTLYETHLLKCDSAKFCLLDPRMDLVMWHMPDKYNSRVVGSIPLDSQFFELILNPHCHVTLIPGGKLRPLVIPSKLALMYNGELSRVTSVMVRKMPSTPSSARMEPLGRWTSVPDNHQQCWPGVSHQQFKSITQTSSHLQSRSDPRIKSIYPSTLQ